MAGASHEIFNFLLASCPSPPSHRLPPHAASADVRCGVVDPQELVTALRNRFSEKQLRSAGVVQLDDQGALRLPEDLSSHRWWLPLRNSRGRMFDILGESGCLVQRRPALLAMDQDRAFRRALEATGIVFVTASLSDMLMLRCLDWAAATASGLERLAQEDLTSFRQLLGEHDLASGAPAAATSSIQQIYVANWSIASLNSLGSPRPMGQTADGGVPGLAPAIEHLGRLNRVLSLGIGTVQIWEPTEIERDDLRFAMGHGTIQDIVRTLEATLGSARPIGNRPRLADMSLAEALRHLQSAGPDDDLTSESTQQTLMTIAKREFIQPLIEEAEADPDVNRRNRKLQFAMLSSSLLQRQLPTFLTQITDRLADRANVTAQDLNEIVGLAKVIEKLARADVDQAPRPLRLLRPDAQRRPKVRGYLA